MLRLHTSWPSWKIAGTGQCTTLAPGGCQKAQPCVEGGPGGRCPGWRPGSRFWARHTQDRFWLPSAQGTASLERGLEGQGLQAPAKLGRRFPKHLSWGPEGQSCKFSNECPGSRKWGSWAWGRGATGGRFFPLLFSWTNIFCTDDLPGPRTVFQGVRLGGSVIPLDETGRGETQRRPLRTESKKMSLAIALTTGGPCGSRQRSHWSRDLPCCGESCTWSRDTVNTPSSLGIYGTAF